MDSWHVVTFADREAVAQQQQYMLAIWQGYWIATDQHRDFGVFIAHDLETAAGSFFFTPPAKMLALRFGAMACARPEKLGNLQLLLGDHRAMDLLPHG